MFWIVQLDAVKLLFVVSISTLLPKFLYHFHAAKVCIGKVSSLVLNLSSSLNFFFLPVFIQYVIDVA